MKARHLLCLAAALPLAAFAQHKQKPVDLTGSWKEVRRETRDGKATVFDDTTYYDFLIGNEYTTQRRNQFMYRGTYKTTPGTLDLGMRMYNVLSWSPNQIVLKDDGGTYQFVRYTKAPERENNAAASSSGRGPEHNAAPEPVSLGALKGRWDVFKRTSSTTLPEIDYKRIIRSIELRPGQDTLGLVYASDDLNNRPSWKIDRYEDNVLYCSGKSARSLKVLRCKDGELIVQEGVITYFFKRFD
jgi:hypothetical protein